ncbi:MULTISPECIES: hypothetical protein [Roseobacter]|uniref:hypothetical protein n=1 Tax=Roseobacter TaxID=2433 RepID=UPI000160EAA3|nr:MULTISPECIES: hypothetical protein [Roseobacter]GIT89129.1 hypothetical protein ROBYS_41450 [Roseobacter sp. OBYS 0001]
MTMRERFAKSQRAIDRGHLRGVKSLCMHEVAQEAIEQTRELLSSVSQMGIKLEETGK